MLHIPDSPSVSPDDVSLRRRFSFFGQPVSSDDVSPRRQSSFFGGSASPGNVSPRRQNPILLPTNLSSEQASSSNSRTQMRPSGSSIQGIASGSRQPSNAGSTDGHSLYTSPPRSATASGPPAESKSESSSQRFKDAISPLSSHKDTPTPTTAPKLGGGLDNVKVQQQPPTLGFSSISQVETAPVNKNDAKSFATIAEEKAINYFLTQRMVSLFQEAHAKMDPKSFQDMADQMEMLPVGLPREVQVTVEKSRLRTNLMTLLDSIVQFDVKKKVGGTESVEMQSEMKQMPAGTGTSVPTRTTSAEDGDEQRRTFNSLFRYPEHVTQGSNNEARQAHMQSIAKDIRELKDNFVESNTKTMPVLLKQIADELGSMNATNKELVELLKQKVPTHSTGSDPPTGQGYGHETRSEDSRGPFQFGSGPRGPFLGLASATPPASGFAVGLSKPQSPKDDQIAALKDQLRDNQDEIKLWKDLHDDTEREMRKFLQEIEDKNAELELKDIEIARMNAHACSKNNGIQRHQDQPKIHTPYIVDGRFIGSGQMDAAARSAGEQASPRSILRPVNPASGSLSRQISSAAASASGSGLFGGAAHQSATQPATGPSFGNTRKPAPGSLFAGSQKPSSTGSSASGRGLFGATTQQSAQSASSGFFSDPAKPSPGGVFAQPAPGSGLFGTVNRQSGGNVMPGSFLGGGEDSPSGVSFTSGGGDSVSLSRPRARVTSLFGRRGKQATDGWKGIPPLFRPTPAAQVQQRVKSPAIGGSTLGALLATQYTPPVNFRDPNQGPRTAQVEDYLSDEEDL
ncbi:hypothetical protein P171DRAFT_470281 [Karstenula rhodostoma CBS 690.94]|uniref:Uncharacterized protein n=1 Tax=Karstenula rhodostoma CBS 690.94 TaxID=1392251 RepID=A0A9P4UGH9_9PLEO|nr:hypothetical protein P171DRAFT_470281 [Karstenula rhodostoma CBS 690.94]